MITTMDNLVLKAQESLLQQCFEKEVHVSKLLQ